jgi:RHS repeat-associated protein
MLVIVFADASHAQRGGVQPDIGGPCSGAAATITWTTPTSGQTFPPGTTSITASGKITLIEGSTPTYTLLRDGTSVGSLSAGNFSSTVTGITSGSHSVSVKATSTSNPNVCTGGYSNTSSQTFSVLAGSTPSVTVSAGGPYTAPSAATLTASVSNSYTISSVSYYYSGSLIGTATSAPWTVTWLGSTKGNATGLSPGSYAVTAIATDIYGETGSGTATVSVAPAAVPTVSLTASANSPNLPATLTATATSSSPYTIASVVFYVNGVAYPSSSPGPSTPFTLSLPVSGGSINTATNYAVSAQAINYWNSGSSGISNTVNISEGAHPAPTVTVSAPGSGASAPASTTLTATASPTSGSTISSVQFYQGSTALGSPVTAAPYSYHWTNIAAGTYSVTAKATDNLGTVGTSSPATYTVVADPGATVSMTSPTSGATGTAPASTTLTATATPYTGYTVSSVQFYQGATAVGPALTSSPYTYSWTNIPQGSYSIAAKATDSQGIVTSSSPVTYTVTNPQPTVAIGAPATGTTIASGKTVTLSANATAAIGTVSSVQFYDGSALLGSGTASGSTYSYTWITSGTGTHTVTAKVTDSYSDTTTSSAITINVVTDGGPTVTMTSPTSGGSGTAPASVILTATAAPVSGDNIASLQFYENGTAVGPLLTSAPYTYTWTGVGQGSYSLTAKATDNLGVTGTSAVDGYTVNNPPPSVNITSPTSGTTVASSQSVTLTATATAAIGTVSSVQFYDGSTLLGSGTGSGSTYTYSWSGGAVGSHSITAKATDSYGDTTASAVVNVTIVTDGGPSVSVSSNTPSSTAPGSFSLTATAVPVSGESIAKVQFMVGASALGPPITSAPYTYAWTNVAGGAYSVTAIATDNLGISTTSSPVSLNVDILGAAITSPANNSSAALGQPITLTASASASDESVASVQFYDGSTLLGAGTGGGGIYTYNWTGAALGTHNLTVKVTDTTGDPLTSAVVAINVIQDAGVYYIFPDQSNTPRVITAANANGSIAANQIVWRWDQTDPFGLTPPSVTTITSNLRFPGQMYDQEDNLFYNYYRNYDPTLGRYIQSDPIGLIGGLNTYLYAAGNPVAYSDPRGLDNPGMGPYGSHLNFDPVGGTLTITAPDGTQTSYDAANNTDSQSRGAWPSGDYGYDYSTTHKDDGPDSAFGSNGNAVYKVPGCVGCGVHSGRQNSADKKGRKGPQHATEGCIRTTDDATDEIRKWILQGNPPDLTVR